MTTKKPTRSVKTSKKKQGIFQQLIATATATRKSVFITGLIGVLLFSSVGYYVVNRSSAGTTASICGSGFRVISQKNTEASSTVYLMVNTSTQVLCALHLSTGTKYNSLRTMEVNLRIVQKYDDSRPANSSRSDGPAPYYKYAGPLKLSYKGTSWAAQSNIDKYVVVVDGKASNKNVGSPNSTEYWPGSYRMITAPVRQVTGL